MTEKYVPATGEKLKFECTMCGDCCRNHILPVTAEKLARISNTTGRSTRSLYFVFKELPGADTPNYLSLRRKITKNGLECIFLKNNLCSLHTIDPELKPENCKHVPYNLIIENETTGWSTNDKKDCKYMAKIADSEHPVYFAVSDSCPGVGTGGELTKQKQEELKKAMTEDEINLIKTSEAVRNNRIPITASDSRMMQYGQEITKELGEFGIAKSGTDQFSYLVYPKELAKDLKNKKLLDCVKNTVNNHDFNKNTIFRFSILREGKEVGMLIGLYGKHNSNDIIAKLEPGQHNYGYCDVGNGEYYCLR
jgi:Fe-S-cluster containining protein